MPTLAGGRDHQAHSECWHVYYGDIRVGSIGIRSGVPKEVDQWRWDCSFYPMSHHGDGGIAPNFFKARADFEAAWHRVLPKITQADFPTFGAFEFG